MITAQELRKKYLNFFKSKNHTIIPSAPLIPENDPTVLFTTAGMHPLVPYILGEKHPGGKRLAGAQKCVRTGDIEEVGDNTHLTFFEMLGNWSLGDYFKKEAIDWSFEFLINELKIPIAKLAISVFGGEGKIQPDFEAKNIWISKGIPESKIAILDKEDNFWGPAGKTGPCGPDTEMFYWSVEEEAPPNHFDPTDKRWVEIWNDVFMEFYKESDGSYMELSQKNVDTGMGLERTLMSLNGKSDVFQTELFVPIIEKIENLLNAGYSENKKAMRIIADHLKASCFIISDGIVPSNKEQGYVLRRIIRRSLRYIYEISKKSDENAGKLLPELAESVIKIYETAYPEIVSNAQNIKEALKNEEIKFLKSLAKGIDKINQIIKIKKESGKSDKIISGKEAFDLYQNFGFPPELTEEILIQNGLDYNRAEFKQELEKAKEIHKEASKAGAERKFVGGLADHSFESTKLHTATHLLHKSLRNVLGEHVGQKGSNITEERLRFDFSHIRKLNEEEIKKVEDMVNVAIQKDYPVHYEIMDIKSAKEAGALGFFDDKYAQLENKIKVYTVGDEQKGYFSKEICGGPHVERTGILGRFKIIKEEAVSAGIRRIKAILE